MKVAIDSAGRVVIPKRIRDEIGLTPGIEAELSVDGAGIRIEPFASGQFIDEHGFMVIPATGNVLTDEQVRELRLADQA